MPHPADGVLRRFLDEPDGTTAADRAHLAWCDRCRTELDAMRDDADLVLAALAPDAAPAVDVDPDVAWRRLAGAATAAAPARPVAPRRPHRWGDALRRPVVAGVAVAVVLAGAGTAAANGWLEIFRTERVEAVPFRLDDLNALPELDAYGEFTPTGDPDLRSVADAAAAEAATGLDVPEVAALPRGVTGEPELRVGGEVGASFDFSTDRAERAAEEAGAPLPPPPPGLDGSRVRFVAGPGVVQVWRQRTGLPALLVGRAVAPTATSSAGLGFEEVRDYLLSLPGLPDEVADPLRTFNADGTTLPIPVPAGRFSSAPAEVGGAAATVLEAHDRTVAAVIWVEGGELTIVAGSLDADEVLAVARGLR